MEGTDLPFRAEYAKSSRASCKECKGKIDKDELRMATMVQSPMFDGKVPHWYHFRCFFPKFKVKTEGDIAHFESLRWEDQEKIRSKVGDTASTSTPPTKGKKRKSEASTNGSQTGEFSVEYAVSSRASCKGCEGKILKDEVRISKMDRESDKARRFGPHPGWYHVECFVQARNELEFFEDASKIPGFVKVSAEDQELLKQKIAVIKNKEIKKPKMEEEDEGVKKALKEQSAFVYKFRDALEKNLKKAQMVELLEYNEQAIPSGQSRILDRLSDIMAFGPLEQCSECQGQLVFSNSGYNCTGDLTEWTKCTNITKTPLRRPFKIPEDYKEEFPFLNKYKYKKKERVFSTLSAPSASTATKTATVRTARPLDNAKIVFTGKLTMTKEDLRKTIARLGGTVFTQIDTTTACVISTKEDVKKMVKKIREAQEMDIHVVSEDFLTAVEKGGLALMIQQYSIAKWGSNPEDRINAFATENKQKSGAMKNEPKFSSGKSTKVKLTVKGGAAVEEESELADMAHVFEDKAGPFNAVLGMVEISKGTNSFYKLQILKSDRGEQFWVYRAWGRVGTTIGGNKKEEFDMKQEAVDEFKRLYEEKTGTMWENRKDMQKVPGRFYPLDIDYGSSDSIQQKLQVGSASKLPKSVQELICLIFDVEKMKKALLEYEIDLQKMPLGKLSRKQIMRAYSVLSEIQGILEKGDVKNKKTLLLDASNRFFTLIPHDFGSNAPPILDSEDVIKQKTEMLDFLLDVEIGYGLANAKEESGEGTKDPIDMHYEQLKTKIEVLEKENEEFKNLIKYVENTHAETHKSYELDVTDIYKVSRQGEAKRYRPFKSLHNRKLLWHGTRTTNMAGILSQGLRIAPPEAPVTGYMFGKGIYFADMVSKSANYCFANKENNTGLLLLCEVALGNMHELPHADPVTKLPNDKHSTKGLGQTFPDPEKIHITNDGVEIPFGAPVKAKVQSSLLYNEFIVYDIAQVNIKYLLKMNFKFKY